MARGFGPTVGTNYNDKITSAYTTAQTGLISLAFWTVWRSNGQFGFGSLWTQANNITLAGNAVTGRMAAFTGFSITPGTFSWPLAASTTIWKHVCFVYDYSLTTNVPVVYVNGAAVSVTTDTPPVGTAPSSAGALTIGGASTGSAIDGKLAEVGYWNGALLTATEVAVLAKGVPPFKIRPAALSLYYPLYGIQTNDPSWGASKSTGTNSGSVFQPHAPVSTILRRAA